MAQFARPNADTVIGNWVDEGSGTTNIFNSIDEDVSSPNDADYIESPSAPASEACAFALSTVEDPVASTGHIMRWRRGKDVAGGADIDLTVELRQSYVSEGSQGTLINSFSDAAIPDAFTTTTDTLSGAEADAITDYSALFVRFVANQV